MFEHLWIDGHQPQAFAQRQLVSVQMTENMTYRTGASLVPSQRRSEIARLTAALRRGCTLR